MPPAHGNEQDLAGFEHGFEFRSLREQREALGIGVLAIHLTVNADVVVNEVSFERWDQGDLLSAQYLREQDVHGVVMQRRSGPRGAEPEEHAVARGFERA